MSGELSISKSEFTAPVGPDFAHSFSGRLGDFGTPQYPPQTHA